MMSFRLVPKSLSLNDLERRNDPYFALLLPNLVVSEAHCQKPWFGSHSNLTKRSGADRQLHNHSTDQYFFVTSVFCWTELFMKQRVNKVSATCFYQLRRLPRRVGQDVTLQLVMAFVISRFDYCNSVLAALSSSTLHPLQSVQNTTARLVFELLPRDHVTPALIQLGLHTSCPYAGEFTTDFVFLTLPFLFGRHRLDDGTSTNQKRTAIS